MSARVTIYDVAARAGVSISTVSLVMNAPSRVSPATRQKVIQAADDLGFEPKSEAVNRARRGVGRIGILAPFTSYPSYGRRLNGVLRATRGTTVETVLFDLESAATSASPLLGSLPLTGRLDGLIVMGLPLEDAVADRLREQRLPTVLVDAEHDGFDSVQVDDHAGGRMVAEHLLGLGARTFAFFGEQQQSHRYVSPAERRLAGFRDGLARAGVAPAGVHVSLVEQRRVIADRGAVQLLQTLAGPTAIFAHDDVLAASVLRAARRLELSVPDEIAVVGFDDSEVAAALDLTTVRQPFEESGRTALQILLRRIAEPDTSIRDVTLKLTLIPRDSSHHDTPRSPANAVPRNERAYETAGGPASTRRNTGSTR
jgi:DNA-binding LacI/PurR family transcriptional regulator